MKRIYLTICSLLILFTSITSIAKISDETDDLLEVFQQFLGSDTFTASVAKQDPDMLSVSRADVLNDTNFRKIELDFSEVTSQTESAPDSTTNSESDANSDANSDAPSSDNADSDIADSDDAMILDFDGELYLSSDNTVAYFFAKPGTLGFPSYVKAEVRDQSGMPNTLVQLNTHLSDLALEMKSMHNSHVSLKVNPQQAMFEFIMSVLESTESTITKLNNTNSDKSLSKNIEVLHNIKALLTNLRSVNLKTSTKDDGEPTDSGSEADSSSDSSETVESFMLTLMKKSSEDLISEENKVRADTSLQQVGNNSYIDPVGYNITMFTDVSKTNYPQSLKVNMGTELQVEYSTSLSYSKLNFEGSNDKVVNITFSPMDLLDAVMSFDYQDIFF